VLLRNTSTDTVDSLERQLPPAQQAWQDLLAIPDTPHQSEPTPRTRRAQTQDEVAISMSGLHVSSRQKAHSEADLSVSRSMEVEYLERSQIE
jgi:hypothetical protein